jgi:DnaJ-class molecular chaperone
MNEDAGRPNAAAADPPEAQALGVLGLSPPVAFDQVKARYRELAKLHHPDANGGDKAAEERLKTVNQAYTVLKAWYGV